MNIKFETLINALSRQFKKDIISADYQTMRLQGGTVGNVQLVTGIAETAAGDKLPYRIVLKIQKKWERYGDPGSWRREYDLYASDLEATFSDTFRWPTCYHAEINAEETEFQLWLEYIDGVTGLDLTGDMYEQAALELGRYQGKLYAEQPRCAAEPDQPEPCGSHEEYVSALPLMAGRLRLYTLGGLRIPAARAANAHRHR